MFEPTITIGSFTLRTYTLLITLAIVSGIAWCMYRTPAGQRRVVFDVCLGGLIGGLLVARLVHVALNWRYFTYNIPEITDFTAGGLDWRGAVVGSIFGMGLVSRWRLTSSPVFLQLEETDTIYRVPATGETTGIRRAVSGNETPGLPFVLDALTPALPLIALAAWWGCRTALCAYGAEVRSMADYPAWLTWEAMDAFGIVAPRFQTQAIGMMAAFFLLIVALVVMRLPRLAGRGFWLVLGLLAIVMFFLGFLRGDYAPHIYGLRLDMLLDVILGIWAGVMLLRAKQIN